MSTVSVLITKQLQLVVWLCVSFPLYFSYCLEPCSIGRILNEVLHSSGLLELPEGPWNFNIVHISYYNFKK